MAALLLAALLLSSFYCAGTWVWLCYRSFKYGEDWENETFHLGLCFIIAVGFASLTIR